MPADPDAWSRDAEEQVLLCGLNDAAEQLCRANMRVGISKIRHAEAQLGLPRTACFIGTPDATVTRNTKRWLAGFGYGGLVCWHPQIFVLDAKPNGCGMLVGATDSPSHEEAVREAAARARRTSPVLEGVALHYDLGESNHFVDALELETVLATDAPPPPAHLFIIHSSGHEHRASSPLGPGLYLEESPTLQRLAREVSTPWGPLHLLEGEQARAFHSFCTEVQGFNARRRQLYASLLFGAHRVLANRTHQGLRDPGELLLGAYDARSDGLFPLTLGPDQPVFLIRPRPREAAAAAGRAGARERLLDAGLLPHGGGYSFPSLRRLISVSIRGPVREFHLEPAGGGEVVRVEDVRALPFQFRGEEVLERVVALGLADPVARYRIRYVIKD